MIRKVGMKVALALALWLASLLVLAPSLALADGSLSITAGSNNIDLSPNRNPLVSARQDISVQGPQESNKTVLHGAGPGPEWYWSLFSFQNIEDKPQDMVLAIEPQRFPGSGLWAHKPWGPRALGAVVTRDGSKPDLTLVDGGQILRFQVPAKETLNIAVESRGPELSARLWQAAGFQNSKASADFFSGMSEGILTLLVLGLAMLWLARPALNLLAGTGLAFAVWLFFESASGNLASKLGFETWQGANFLAMAENLLVAAASFCIYAFSPAPPSNARRLIWAVTVPLLAVANAGFGWAEPQVATTVARVALALIAVLGFLFLVQRNEEDRRSHAFHLVIWCVFVLWLGAVGAVAQSQASAALLNSLLGVASSFVPLVMAALFMRMLLEPKPQRKERRASRTDRRLEKSDSEDWPAPDQKPVFAPAPKMPRLTPAPLAPTTFSALQPVKPNASQDADIDAVTGLGNRGKFTALVEKQLAAPEAESWRVLMLDIDRFKLLNEGFGEKAGDAILKAVATRLTDALDADEAVARLSGAQFALLCKDDMTRGDFSAFADKLQKAIAAPIQDGEKDMVVSASIGISSPSKAGTTQQDLLAQATLALAEAHQAGGARAATHHAEMRNERSRILALEQDLRRALARNEIRLLYQPIVYLGTLELVGFEALARWQHAELGLLSPSEFIDLAETTGLMPEIGDHILAQAARQLGIWQRVHRYGQPFFVSVNISPKQLEQLDFADRLQKIMARESLVPGSLKLEITESVIIPNPRQMSGLLHKLKAMGVGLACDDFGSGFSSLASVRDFPFDTLKMDRSFLPEGQLEERDVSVINTITRLANSLNMAVVAEGIESQAQIDRLASLGVGFGQGFFIARPEDSGAASVRLSRLNMKQLFNEPAQHVPTVQHYTPPSQTWQRPALFPPPPLLPQTASIYAPQPKQAPAPSRTAEYGEELPSIFTLGSKTKAKAKPEPRRAAKHKKPIKKKRR